MALFTKLFERSHNPYEIVGARWYKIHLTSDGTNYSVDLSKSDLRATVSGTTVRLTAYTSARIIDVVLDGSHIAGVTIDYIQHIFYLGAVGQLGFSVPAAAKFTELDAYVLVKGM